MFQDPLYNEKELLLLIAGGDEHAFGILFDRYWTTVYVHVLSFVKNGPQAEDVTQDIFFGIWTNREKLIDVEQFDYYLRAMTRNRSISELRKKLATAGAVQVDDLQGLKTANQPDELFVNKQVKEVLLEAVGKLPPRRREIFTLSRMEGLTHAEIAQQLNISKATVNEHIGEALVFLRAYLANY